ncbi:MAG: peptide chain release factor-like protein [bacterium]|nr:peptide chain release factor-like protein [bacterium]
MTDVNAKTTDHLNLDDPALLARCQVDTYRASGPGGQKRNKTDSAVRIRLPALGLMVTAGESRSQHENKARALRRLREQIALQIRRPMDVDGYRPSALLAGCLTRRSQLVVGRRDERYAPVVAEVLDLITACGGRISTAAGKVGVTTGALSTFLRRDAKLLACVNDLRRGTGLRPLR